MKAILLCLSLLTTLLTFSQNRFPQDFTGHWKGTLEWYAQGKTSPQRINMELIISPSTDTAGQYEWQIIYGDAAHDNRPYLLKPVDTATGHWIIDERSGILLDQYWQANQLTGIFTVGKNTIQNQYHLQDGQLHVAFTSYKATPVRTSGKGDEEIPFVDSYQLAAIQHAILKRIEE